MNPNSSPKPKPKPNLSPSPKPQMGPVNLESLVDFQSMVFIYNAINDGWTVKKIPSNSSRNRYEFRKNDHRVTSEDCLDEYLQKFVQYYREIKMM